MRDVVTDHDKLRSLVRVLYSGVFAKLALHVHLPYWDNATGEGSKWHGCSHSTVAVDQCAQSVT